ncbi:MAG TPA: hypothetical protein VJS30_24420 [Paraburkholderia sp.]|nr:hypothetical protein [Paraburkholderia sp.]
MGILDKGAEIAGAVAAVEAGKALNPQAALLAERVAVVPGYKVGAAPASRAESKPDEAGASDMADIADAVDAIRAAGQRV